MSLVGWNRELSVMPYLDAHPGDLSGCPSIGMELVRLHRFTEVINAVNELPENKRLKQIFPDILQGKYPEWKLVTVHIFVDRLVMQYRLYQRNDYLDELSSVRHPDVRKNSQILVAKSTQALMAYGAWAIVNIEVVSPCALGLIFTMPALLGDPSYTCECQMTSSESAVHCADGMTPVGHCTNTIAYAEKYPHRGLCATLNLTVTNDNKDPLGKDSRQN